MFEQVKTIYIMERFTSCQFIAGRSIPGGKIRANVLMASLRTLRALWKKAYFNMFQRRRAMNDFVKLLTTHDCSKPYSKDKSIHLTIKCNEIMSDAEAQQVLDESQRS